MSNKEAPRAPSGAEPNVYDNYDNDHWIAECDSSLLKEMRRVYDAIITRLSAAAAVQNIKRLSVQVSF